MTSSLMTLPWWYYITMMSQVLFCKMTDYQQELYEEYVTGPDVAAMMVGRKKVGLSELVISFTFSLNVNSMSRYSLVWLYFGSCVTIPIWLPMTTVSLWHMGRVKRGRGRKTGKTHCLFDQRAPLIKEEDLYDEEERVHKAVKQMRDEKGRG